MTGLKPLRMQAESKLECQILPGDSASNLVAAAERPAPGSATEPPVPVSWDNSAVSRAISAVVARKYRKGGKGATKAKLQMRPRGKKRKQALEELESVSEAESSEPVPTDESDVEEGTVFYGPKDAIRSLVDEETNSEDDVSLTDETDDGTLALTKDDFPLPKQKRPKLLEKPIGEHPLDEVEFAVKKIVNKRVSVELGVQYLICWSGYNAEDDTWVNEADVNAPEAIAEYLSIAC